MIYLHSRRFSSIDLPWTNSANCVYFPFRAQFRSRHVLRELGGWRDCGYLFPDRFWAGSRSDRGRLWERHFGPRCSPARLDSYLTVSRIHYRTDAWCAVSTLNSHYRELIWRFFCRSSHGVGGWVSTSTNFPLNFIPCRLDSFANRISFGYPFCPYADL